MSTSVFNKALSVVLQFEGGYTRNTNDLGNVSGSGTNKGVIQTTYDSYKLSKQMPKADVKNITDTEVAEIYRDRYWYANGCNLLPAKLALLVFDTAVNMGSAKVVSYFQELLGSKATAMNAQMINDINYYLSKHSEDDLILAFITRRKQSYRAYAAKGNQRVFLQGWLNRVEHLKGVLKQWV